MNDWTIELKRATADGDARVAALVAALREQARRVAELSELVAEGDHQVDELRKGVALSQEQVEELSAGVAKRTRQLEKLDAVLASRNETVAALSRHLAQARWRGHEAAAMAAREASAREAARADVRRLEGVLEHEKTRIRELESHADALGKKLFAADLRLRLVRESTFWRATRWIRFAWRFVENRVLGWNYRFNLVPNQDLQPASGAEHEWRAVGADPFFELQPVECRYPSGWLRVRARLQRRSEDHTLKLYYDAGEGLSERTAIVLPVTAASTVNEMIFLPRGVRQLRWDPMQSSGELTQGPIVMSRMSLPRRALHRFMRVRRLIREVSPLRRQAKGVSWRAFLARPHETYRAASALRNYVPQSNYAAWLSLQDGLSASDREGIRRHIAALRSAPTVSVVMPVYNASAEHLRAAIESVRAQLYERWELCIADDASTLPHVRRILAECARRDPRIKVAYRPANGHIAAASNSALELASGEFVALLDHDDVLAEHALYHVVAELDAHPDTDILYSDEDKVDADGERRDPHFKPDWNPDLLLSNNYVSHLGVYRTALVRSVGGFRVGYEGSQDFDLLLRCLAAGAERRIRHIPVILYHWRESAGSTALNEADKGYATPNGVKALRDYFSSRAIPGVEVQPGPFHTTYRVRYPLPAQPPKVSLIVPTRDGYEVLRACVESILEKTTYPNFEIVIVDNQSTEERTLRFFDELESEPRVRLLRYDRPYNYAAINNFAVAQVDGELVGLVNNDIEVINPDWLDEMASHALRPEVGAVGAKLYYGNDTVQHAGVITGLGGVAGHSHKHYPRAAPGYNRRLCLLQNLSAVTAACMLVRRSTFLALGGLNEVELKIAFNDVDFCLRLTESGLRNVWTPHAEMYHHESATRGPEDSPEKVARFQGEIRYMLERWGERLLRDPCYSPMLTLDRENFAQNFSATPRKPWLASFRR